MIGISAFDIQRETEIDWNEARRFLRRCLARRLHGLDESDIDDATQDAIVRLIRAIRKEGVNNLEALMTTIACRTALDLIRTRYRSSVLFKPMTDATMNQTDARSPVPDILGDPQERVEFFVLEFFRGRKTSCLELARAFFERRNWKSVAQELGIKQDAVRARWSRCVSMLRQAVAKDPDFRMLVEWAKG